MVYTIRIKDCGSEGYYSRVLNLAGVATGGDTPAEALDNATEALGAVLPVYRKFGRVPYLSGPFDPCGPGEFDREVEA